MLLQFHPYFVVLAISSFTTLVVAVVTGRRAAPGSVALGGMLMGMSTWSATYALTWIVIPLEGKIIWLKVMYFGVVLVPALFLVFTLQITHREHWLTFRNLVLLSIEPIAMLVVVWSAPHFVFASIGEAVKGGYAVMQVQRGMWFYVNIFYSYAVILLAFYILTVSYFQANPFFRRQYLIILAGSAIPLVFSIYTQRNYDALNDFDLAPSSFGIAGIFYAYAIYRRQFMDLIPVARGRLIENMSDGVLVIDAQGRVVDINPVMGSFLNEEPSSFIGRKVIEALKTWTENPENLLNGFESRSELHLSDKPPRYLDLRVTPLYDRYQRLTGRLIVIRDITDRKEVERDLRDAMDRMQTQLIKIGVLQSRLREQAIRDALTNLFNRRYLEETLERELARAARELYPLCIVMMDLDHFKNVNDTYGHEAGDVVLRALADTVTRQSRQGDFVCRFGGEEFVLVMPNIGIEAAKARAKGLHKAIERLTIPYGPFNLSITISMGIAWYPAHGDTKDELLRAADRALYAAKNAGRNRVFVHRDREMNEV